VKYTVGSTGPESPEAQIRRMVVAVTSTTPTAMGLDGSAVK